MQAKNLIAELNAAADPNLVPTLSRFFKTGPGEYGAGDQFIGLKVPINRSICKNHLQLPPKEIAQLLSSKIHEHRLAGTIIMSKQFKKVEPDRQTELYQLYLTGLQQNWINNWDIVDTSCEHVVGAFTKINHLETELFRLADSANLWEKRTAMISCFAWVRKQEIGPTMQIVEILGDEQHDLLQKAVGWMLREVGKYVDTEILIEYLAANAATMPRTQLRYAIEKFSPSQRQNYLQMRRLNSA